MENLAIRPATPSRRPTARSAPRTRPAACPSLQAVPCVERAMGSESVTDGESARKHVVQNHAVAPSQVVIRVPLMDGVVFKRDVEFTVSTRHAVRRRSDMRRLPETITNVLLRVAGKVYLDGDLSGAPAR